MFGDVIQRARDLPAGEACRLLEDALARGRHRAPPEDVANLLVHLAAYARDEGDFPLALTRLEEAADLFERRFGPADPRSRHARSQIALVRERSGDLAGALADQRALDAEEHRPSWRWLHIAELERRRGDARAADEALEHARRGALGDDPMVSCESILRTARILAAEGSDHDAVALLTAALTGVDEVLAGKRLSPSARVPSQVRALFVAELERIGKRT